MPPLLSDMLIADQRCSVRPIQARLARLLLPGCFF
jgi:hypothetical protein